MAKFFVHAWRLKETQRSQVPCSVLDNLGKSLLSLLISHTVCNFASSTAIKLNQNQECDTSTQTPKYIELRIIQYGQRASAHNVYAFTHLLAHGRLSRHLEKDHPLPPMYTRPVVFLDSYLQVLPKNRMEKTQMNTWDIKGPLVWWPTVLENTHCICCGVNRSVCLNMLEVPHQFVLGTSAQTWYIINGQWSVQP